MKKIIANKDFQAYINGKLHSYIKGDEIENLNCQHVLDNQVNYGTISSSTYYFNPISESINTSAEIDGVQGTIISRKNGTIDTNSYNIVDNV